MGDIVIDSSFVIAVLVDEEHTAWASERMLDLDGGNLIAPALLVWEVGSVLQKKIRQKRISLDERAAILDRFLDLGIELRPPFDAAELSSFLKFCDRHGLTAYDAAYLRLAMDVGGELASLDTDLIQAARAESLTVHSPS